MEKKITLFAVMVMAVQLQVSLAGSHGGYSVEEAPFSVIKKAKDYEIRLYPENKWVCTNTNGKEFKIRDQADSFFALHEYIMGENSEGVKLSMTGPTTVRTVPNADSHGNTLFQMCLYIPKLYQKNPPQPNEEGVFIQHRLPLTVAVRQFGAFMMKETEWESQMELLRSDLKAANEPNMDFNDFYGAGYDPPFKADARHNEVWIVKKE